MPCHSASDKPLAKPMLTDFELDPQEYTSMKIEIKPLKFLFK